MAEPVVLAHPGRVETHGSGNALVETRTPGARHELSEE